MVHYHSFMLSFDLVPFADACEIIDPPLTPYMMSPTDDTSTDDPPTVTLLTDSPPLYASRKIPNEFQPTSSKS